MRVRYIKPNGDGNEVDLPDASARRLIESGAAEEVESEEPEPTTDEPKPARKAAKKTRGK